MVCSSRSDSLRDLGVDRVETGCPSGSDQGFSRRLYICLLRDGDLILGHFEEQEEQEEYSPPY
jgi:hypothetical protein